MAVQSKRQGAQHVATLARRASHKITTMWLPMKIKFPTEKMASYHLSTLLSISRESGYACGECDQEVRCGRRLRLIQRDQR